MRKGPDAIEVIIRTFEWVNVNRKVEPSPYRIVLDMIRRSWGVESPHNSAFPATSKDHRPSGLESRDGVWLRWHGVDQNLLVCGCDKRKV